MRNRHAGQLAAGTGGDGGVGRLGLGQGDGLVDVDKGAQILVGLGAGQKVLCSLDRGDFTALELGGQLGQAQVMQFGRSAHANLAILAISVKGRGVVRAGGLQRLLCL